MEAKLHGSPLIRGIDKAVSDLALGTASFA